MVVEVQDDGGNRVTTANHTIALSLGQNTGSTVFQTDFTSFNLVDTDSRQYGRTVSTEDGFFSAMAFNPLDGLVYGVYLNLDGWSSGPQPKAADQEPFTIELRTIDPVTGVQTTIGPNLLLAKEKITGLAFKDGKLYAAGGMGSMGDQNPAMLYEVNTATAAMTEIGYITISGGMYANRVLGMETDPTTGVIYATVVAGLNNSKGEKGGGAPKNGNNQCPLQLVTIDPNTHAATTIGCQSALVYALSFRRDGTLVGTGVWRETPAIVFFELDKTTGGATQIMTGRPTMFYGLQQITWAPAELTGTLTAKAVNGQATFVDLMINAPGVGYTLKCAVNGTTITGQNSAPFDILSARPTQLVFKTQPAQTELCTTISPAVQVELRNIRGEVVTTATNEVTISLGHNPTGGTLGGVLKKAAVNGVATFDMLDLNTLGTGYTLKAEAAGMLPVLSTPFNVVAGSGGQQISFYSQPGTAAPGAPLPPILVEVRDASGQPSNADNRVITLTLEQNPGTNIIHSYGCSSLYSLCLPALELIDYSTPASMGPLPLALPPMMLRAMSFNPADGLIYALDTIYEPTLLSIDPVKNTYQTLGRPTMDGGHASLRYGLAFKNGTLYAGEESGYPARLFTVDLSTGALTQVGNGGMKSNVGEIRNIYGMETDPTTNTIYALVYARGETYQYHLVRIDEAQNPPYGYSFGKLDENLAPQLKAITFTADGTLLAMGGGPRLSHGPDHLHHPQDHRPNLRIHEDRPLGRQRTADLDPGPADGDHLGPAGQRRGHLQQPLHQRAGHGVYPEGLGLRPEPGCQHPLHHQSRPAGPAVLFPAARQRHRLQRPGADKGGNTQCPGEQGDKRRYEDQTGLERQPIGRQAQRHPDPGVVGRRGHLRRPADRPPRKRLHPDGHGHLPDLGQQRQLQRRPGHRPGHLPGLRNPAAEQPNKHQAPRLHRGGQGQQQPAGHR